LDWIWVEGMDQENTLREEGKRAEGMDIYNEKQKTKGSNTEIPIIQIVV
jgi:hypothetical protein